MKKMIVMVVCILIGSGQALADCVTTVTATTPTADFVVNKVNGTVIHTKTGLMWKQCSEGLSGAGCAKGTVITYTWQGIMKSPQTLNANGGFAGFTDWRVPNIKELNSIMENQCTNPAINATIFPATVVGGGYGSSSPSAYNASNALYVNFGNGKDLEGYKGFNYPVRLVRGGQ